MAYRVFVSHSSRDRDWVEWIKGQVGPGVLLYLAEHDPQPGQHLPSKVTQEIDRSDAVLVFLTENSRASSFVHQEVGYAVRAKKLVIPVVQPGLPSDVLAMLAGVEYIEFDFQAPNEGRSTLLAHLRQRASVKERDELVTAVLLVGGLLLLALVMTSAPQT